MVTNEFFSINNFKVILNDIFNFDLPLKKGDTIAISVFNMELKAFQIKGEYMGVRWSRGVKFGYISVNNVLTQTPPLVSREVLSDN